MTLGPQVKPVRRLAGQWRAWGNALEVQANNPGLTETELVRATLGYPASWSLSVFLDGGLGPLGVIDVLVTTSLGGVSGRQVITLTGPSVQAPVLPATELVIQVRAPATAPRFRIVAQVAPISSWSPWEQEGTRWG